MRNFEHLGIDAKKTLYSPDGIIINQRLNLYEYSDFKNGLIEIQDESSQLISYALSPKTKTIILDACAGAGGKSLHLSAITNNECNITAVDIDLKKLRELKKRATRAGAKKITILSFNEFDKLVKAKKNDYYDYILIDAPCSGIGTVKRSPWLKYQLTLKSLMKRQKQQLEILDYYSKFVKPNGVILYSTCSLLPEENENVIAEFLSQNKNFVEDNINENLSIELPFIEQNTSKLTILPHLFGSDGFFLARLKRIK